MDFENNKRRIIQSIEYAIKNKCKFRVGAELEVCGYSCDDHFKELDLFSHCWETVAEILKLGLSKQIVIDLGMPVLHRSVAFNCKIIIYNNKIVLIRPKMHLADEGNYREKRFFMAYSPQEAFQLEKFYLPDYIKKYTGQDYCDLGFANLRFPDALVGLEICEEVWRANSISRHAYLMCDVIICSNGSHFQKGKISVRHNLIKEILQKCDGVYLYVNALGFDGASYYFDGSNLVMTNDGVVQMGDPCSMREMDLNTVVIDLFEQREDRIADNSIMEEALRNTKIPDVFVDCYFADCEEESTPIIQDMKFDCPQKQMLLASSSYLWDYIRKSGACGIFLPLSGGADSGLTALIVYYMCERLYKYYQDGAEDVIASLRKVVGIPDYKPTSPKDIVGQIFETSYMASKNSSEATRKRSKELAEQIGSHHTEIEIDGIVHEFRELTKKFFNITMKFQSEGGTWAEDIALQNIFARVRMVLSYLLAQLAPVRRKKNGFYIVLAAGNLDETLTGYYTKYDCSSGDLNLIGSLSKVEIAKLLDYLHSTFNWKVISDIEKAKPTAELKPPSEEQTDEQEIGLTFKEIDIFADIRTNKNCSVISFFKVVEHLLPELDKDTLLDKISKFFTKYSRNRHKVEVLTTSLHLTNKSCSSKRFDLRPLIYEDNFNYEVKRLKELMSTKTVCTTPKPITLEPVTSSQNSAGK